MGVGLLCWQLLMMTRNHGAPPSEAGRFYIQPIVGYVGRRAAPPLRLRRRLGCPQSLDATSLLMRSGPLSFPYLSSLYEAFGPAEARGLAARLEIHYTPEHGSWLNVAEIEQGVLARQALGRRIPTLEAVQKAATAWADRRNRVLRSFLSSTLALCRIGNCVEQTVV